MSLIRFWSELLHLRMKVYSAYNKKVSVLNKVEIELVQIV
jgi:hypothetical protein